MVYERAKGKAMTDGRCGLQQLIARARGAAQGELNFGGNPSNG